MGEVKRGSQAASRALFEAQFTPSGSRYVYRKSQTGAAYMVSPEERDGFLDAYDRKFRCLLWGFVGAVVALIAGLTFLAPSLPQAGMIAAIVSLSVPYLIGSRWVWGEPARQLKGRVPIAAAMPREDARRLALQRVQYGQLATAAFGGLVIAATGFIRGGQPNGWDLVWPALGASLVLLAGVQAFRKWRSGSGSPELASVNDVAFPVEASAYGNVDEAEGALKWLRYAIPAALLAAAAAWMIFTPQGREFFQHPNVSALFTIGIGSWVLYSTIRGLMTGRMQLMMRGFDGPYDRATQPKRFWGSFAWNAAMASFLLVISLMILIGPIASGAEEQCNNREGKFSDREAYDACSNLLDKNTKLTFLSKASVFDSRGFAAEGLGERQQAAADYSHAIGLDPKDDYAFMNRGRFYLDTHQPDQAIADFSRAHELLPKSAEPLAGRGMAYAWKNDRQHADEDFSVVKKIDPKNVVVLHGDGLLAINSGDLEGAIADFTEALHRDPRDGWALQMRADAYQQMGDFAKAGADRTAMAELARHPAAR